MAATSALFVLDIKGRCLISRDYRGNVSTAEVERFFSKHLEKEVYFSSFPHTHIRAGVCVCFARFILFENDGLINNEKRRECVFTLFNI